MCVRVRECVCVCVRVNVHRVYSVSTIVLLVCLKTLSSVNVLISDGNVFHSLVPIATKDDCPNVVLRFAVLIPLFSLFINWQSISGARLFTHLKISFKNEKYTKLSKPRSLNCVSLKFGNDAI